MSDDHWQHPAERGAQSHPDLIVNAPPVSKRLTALLAGVSVLASFAVLFVAIPKGIDEYREDNKETAPTSTVARAKGVNAVRLLFPVHTSTGKTSALSIGHGLWLVATNTIGTNDKVSFDVSSGLTSVIKEVATFTESGISVMRCISACTKEKEIDFAHLADPHQIDDLNSLQVIDAFSIQPFEVTPSVAMTQHTTDSPLHIADAIKGVAVAMNSANHVVGIVVRKNHSNWMLGKEHLDAIAQLANK